MITDLGKSINNTLQSLFNAPITDARIDTAIKEVCAHLLASNVSSKLVLQVKDHLLEKTRLEKIAPGADKAKIIHRAVYEELTRLVDGSAQENITKGKTHVVVFVGLQGCGKTTSVCKIANFHRKRGLKVGIVCADTFRPGAFDQVKQNAIKIKVPYFGSGETDPVVVALEGVNKFKAEKFDLVLVDTSGRHTQERDLFNEMKTIVEMVAPDSVILVMDSGIGQIAETQAMGFKNDVSIGSIVLTKMDGAKKAGGALSAVVATGCPVSYIGTGEAMDDIEKFDAKRFVSKMMGQGDLEGLAEKMKEIKIDEKEMIKKMKTGNFHLRDFYDQFQQLMSLGPLSKVMEMMPGMGGMQMPEENDMKKMFCVFSSMNAAELDSDGTIFERQPKRIIRVAIGSGNTIDKVSVLLIQFKKISQMIKKMSAMPGMEGLLTGDISKMSLAQKSQIKKKAKDILPKDMFDQMSSFMK